MNGKEAFAFGVVVCLLAVTGSGLLYVSVTDGTLGDSPNTSENGTATADQMNETATPSESATNNSSLSSDRGQVIVQSDRVMNASYHGEDGSLKVTFRVTGANWSANIYRSGVSLTTLVPEEHTDDNGNTHPTTSYWNQNSSLPDSKAYAFVGSRIDAGGDTKTTTDDEYVVTVVLPTVVQENVRFTLVEDGEAVTFFEGEY